MIKQIHIYLRSGNCKQQDGKKMSYFSFQTWTSAVVKRWRRAARHWAYDCGGQGTNNYHTKQNRQRHIPLWGQQPPGDQQCWICIVCIRWVMAGLFMDDRFCCYFILKALQHIVTKRWVGIHCKYTKPAECLSVWQFNLKKNHNVWTQRNKHYPEYDRLEEAQVQYLLENFFGIFFVLQFKKIIIIIMQNFNFNHCFVFQCQLKIENAQISRHVFILIWQRI